MCRSPGARLPRLRLAVTQLEHAEQLLAADRASEAEAPLAEAREIFEQLEAKPWLERLAAAEEHVERQAV